MFKIKNLVEYFFSLKSRGRFDSALGRVNKSSQITEIFLKKILKLNSG